MVSHSVFNIYNKISHPMIKNVDAHKIYRSSFPICKWLFFIFVKHKMQKFFEDLILLETYWDRNSLYIFGRLKWKSIYFPSRYDRLSKIKYF